MEISNNEAKVIKQIYDEYYSGSITADEALHELEILINGIDEEV